MKYFYYTFLFLTISCNKIEESKQSEILDELSIGLLEAWSESQSTKLVPNISLVLGDTFTIHTEQRIIKHPVTTPSLDCEDCYFHLPRLSKLRVVKIKEYSVDLEGIDINGITYEGYLLNEDLLQILYPSIDYYRKELLNYFDDKRNELKKELMNKYGLSEEEFYKTVGEEYSKRTGNSGFSY